MLNRIFLIGNLGRDPEMSYTEKGTAITKFSLAVTRIQRNKESGEKETDWFNIITFDKLAETCNNYLHKGSKVFIEGRMQSRKYTDKSGAERVGWDVVANDMRMLDAKQASAGAGGASGGGYSDADESGPEDIPF